MSETRVYKTRYGQMVGFAADKYISGSFEHYGEYCPAEAAALADLVKPGMVVVEAGANIGSHTIALARAIHPAPLYAFEPQQRVFQVLCANLTLNDVTNVLAYPEALGAEPGEAIIPPVDYARATNVGGIGLAKEGRGLRTRVVTIDSLGLPACGLIKVDVEGWELEVLKGAAETLARLRPVLYVENDRTAKQGALIEHVAGLDYAMFWHAPPLFSADNFNGNPENVFGNVASLNMLCVPSERAGKIGLRRIDPNNWKAPFGI